MIKNNNYFFVIKLIKYVTKTTQIDDHYEIIFILMYPFKWLCLLDSNKYCCDNNLFLKMEIDIKCIIVKLFFPYQIPTGYQESTNII
ncbi:hypothetical protein QTP88_025788 [Uroleucon formosanum]